MEAESSLGFYVIASMMAGSLLAGLIVFYVVKPGRTPPVRWIDHPSRLWRWCCRTALFIACFLLPFSVVVSLLSLLDRVPLIRDWSEGAAPEVHLALVAGLTLSLWLMLFRALLREIRAHPAEPDTRRM